MILKERLSILIEAALGRGDARPRAVLWSPGLGKTTLAAILADSMGAQFRTTSGPALEARWRRCGDPLQPAARRRHVHRRGASAPARAVEEILYTALEDFQLDIVVGKGAGANSIRLGLPPFTLIGATTRRAGVGTAA